MFRRHWSALPKDVSFPSSLRDLGYFINEDDEIRSIENSDYYFKYFINRNQRVMDRQRFAFSHAVESIVHERLQGEGLQKKLLPLGASPDEPHVPVFVSADLHLRSRIVLVFGEPVKDLGIMAGRIVEGAGGINQGSMVSLARALHHHVSSSTDAAPPGIILANTGQLFWWPEGKRSLTVTASTAIPLPSLVHHGRRYLPELNRIPGSEDCGRHVSYIFDTVLQKLAKADAQISVIAIGGSCDTVIKLLNDEQNWQQWERNLSSMLLMGHVWSDERTTNARLKQFLAERTRAYAVAAEPLDTPLASASGNPALGIPSLGCPCYSSSEPVHLELVLIRAMDSALRFTELVATTPGFKNPPVIAAEKMEPEYPNTD